MSDHELLAQHPRYLNHLLSRVHAVLILGRPITGSSCQKARERQAASVSQTWPDGPSAIHADVALVGAGGEDDIGTVDALELLSFSLFTC